MKPVTVYRPTYCACGHIAWTLVTIMSGVFCLGLLSTMLTTSASAQVTEKEELHELIARAVAICQTEPFETRLRWTSRHYRISPEESPAGSLEEARERFAPLATLWGDEERRCVDGGGKGFRYREEFWYTPLPEADLNYNRGPEVKYGTYVQFLWDGVKTESLGIPTIKEGEDEKPPMGKIVEGREEEFSISLSPVNYYTRPDKWGAWLPWLDFLSNPNAVMSREADTADGFAVYRFDIPDPVFLGIPFKGIMSAWFATDHVTAYILKGRTTTSIENSEGLSWRYDCFEALATDVMQVGDTSIRYPKAAVGELVDPEGYVMEYTSVQAVAHLPNAELATYRLSYPENAVVWDERTNEQVVCTDVAE